jgi:hypothetical protein
MLCYIKLCTINSFFFFQVSVEADMGAHLVAAGADMAVGADGKEDSAAEDTVVVGVDGRDLAGVVTAAVEVDGKDLAGAVTVEEADMVEAAVVEK